MTTAHCPGRSHLVLTMHRVTEVEMDSEEPLDPSRTFPAPKERKRYWAIPLAVLTSWVAIGGTVLAVWPK